MKFKDLLSLMYPEQLLTVELLGLTFPKPMRVSECMESAEIVDFKVINLFSFKYYTVESGGLESVIGVELEVKE